MKPPSGRKQTIIGLCAVSALMVAGLAAWRTIGGPGCGSCGSHEWATREHLSDEFNQSMSALFASGHKRRMDDREARLALDLIDRHAAALPHEYSAGALSPAEEEASGAVSRSYAEIESRLRHGGVSTQARNRMAERVTIGLNSDNPRERMMAIAAACYGRLVADAEVRAKVVALESDEVKMVREQAVRQLAHYDKIAALEKAGQWSEPKAPWDR